MKKKKLGFTLLELLIAVAIIALTMTIGLPSFQSIIASSRLTVAANAMVGALQLARSEALKQYKSVVVTKRTSWANGWAVFVDVNGNNTQDTNETLITYFDKLNSTITVKTTGAYANYARYDGNGRVNSSGTFTFCSAIGKDFRAVIVALSGRVRVETVNNSTRTYVSECS